MLVIRYSTHSHHKHHIFISQEVFRNKCKERLKIAKGGKIRREKLRRKENERRKTGVLDCKKDILYIKYKKNLLDSVSRQEIAKIAIFTKM